MGDDNRSMFGGLKVTAQECCSCDCIENQCSWRFAGARCCCFHLSCIKCLPSDCFTNCCCCEEEILYMDGDLRRITNLTMDMR